MFKVSKIKIFREKIALILYNSNNSNNSNNYNSYIKKNLIKIRKNLNIFNKGLIK
jgi:hypothetical protein